MRICENKITLFALESMLGIQLTRLNNSFNFFYFLAIQNIVFKYFPCEKVTRT